MKTIPVAITKERKNEWAPGQTMFAQSTIVVTPYGHIETSIFTSMRF